MENAIQLPPATMVVGVIGYIGSGKTTLAKYLRDNYGFVRYPMAKALKEECARALAEADALAGVLGADPSAVQMQFRRYIDDMEDVDRKKRFRSVLQWWGTEFRRLQDEDYWVKKVENAIKSFPNRYVIDDVRFENEVAMIRRLDGFIIRVDRPMDVSGSQFSHASERPNELQCDYVIKNDSDMEKFSHNINDAIRSSHWPNPNFVPMTFHR